MKKKKSNQLCRKCNLPLSFKKLPNGKWYPTNPDGTEHWDLCREEQFRQGKRKPETRASGFITGPQYVKSTCDCSGPPWEECEHHNDEIGEEEMSHIASI